MKCIDVLPYVCLLAYFATVVFGIMRYKYFDNAAKIIFWLILFSFIMEIINKKLSFDKQYEIRNGIYHFLCVIDFSVMILYFLETIKIKQIRRYALLLSSVVIALGTLNVTYFQNITTLNSNMLLLQSFVVIIMAL